MRCKLSALLLTFFLALTSASATALDISFYGAPPDLPTGAKLTVVSGVDAGIPVVFDSSNSKNVMLRPAKDNEIAEGKQALFRFEWQEDKSARFYRLAPSSLIKKLSDANSQDILDAGNKQFEIEVIQQFTKQGAILRACLPDSKPLHDQLKFFIVISSDGTLKEAIVQPEGSIAECILEAAKKQSFSKPPNGRSFTAKAEIQVTP